MKCNIGNFPLQSDGYKIINNISFSKLFFKFYTEKKFNEQTARDQLKKHQKMIKNF